MVETVIATANLREHRVQPEQEENESKPTSRQWHYSHESLQLGQVDISNT
jgi:hypothetical protein